MILYLSRNESANLLDSVANEKSLHIRKISGSLSLSEFIIRDMRKFASCRFFCLERQAVTENDSEFIEALQSFKMMYSARVIVIYECASEVDSFTRGLVQSGVADIITAADKSEMIAQIAECLSDAGMQRYKTSPAKKDDHDLERHEEKEPLVQNLILKETEGEHYRFDCLNINIGIIGATRRVGTTTVALGLANFIKNHGGTVCYAAFNTNRHLESIAEAYGFDTEEDYYTYDAIDFYEGMMPKHDYNFVITDFGDIRREAVRKYKESDVHLLCGASDQMHEVVDFAEGLKWIKSVTPKILTYEPSPKYGQLFCSAVTEEPTIIKPVNHMLDFKTNAAVFKGIIEQYIVETSKRL